MLSCRSVATLLFDTGRHAEAEPLYRRSLRIFHRFQAETGHQHPDWEVAVGNYAGCLESLGLSKPEVVDRLRSAVADPE